MADLHDTKSALGQILRFAEAGARSPVVRRACAMALRSRAKRLERLDELCGIYLGVLILAAGNEDLEDSYEEVVHETYERMLWEFKKQRSDNNAPSTPDGAELFNTPQEDEPQ